MLTRLASPWLLALLPLALLTAWRLARRRARADSRLRLPRAATGIQLGTSAWVRLDRALPWVRGAALVLVVVALSRPQAGQSVEDVSTLGVDIVLALDISGSMKAEDFAPRHRLEVARRVIQRFISGRPSDRIGLVTFGEVATTRCPLTLDHQLLLQMVSEVDFAPEDQQGTAIGMGLGAAVNRLRRSDAKSRVVLLITDGVNNAGYVGPRAAAEAARALGIKVYTIGVGSNGPVPIRIDTPFGSRRQMVEMPLDEPLLRDLAGITNGQMFRATDADSLEQIFATIDSLEPTEIESRMRVLYSERFGLALVPGLGLLLLERLLAGTRLKRIP